MIYYGCFPGGRRNKDKDKEGTKEMETKTYKVGMRVRRNGTDAVGVITEMMGATARCSYGQGDCIAIKEEWLSDITPIIPDTPKTRVGNIIAYWNRKATTADLAAVRSMVQCAIYDCGLDATATVAVDDADYHCVSLGHNPIKAVIRVNGARPAIRMRNGAVVKGMDTITVLFKRNAGVYDAGKHRELSEIRAANECGMSREDALAAGDAMPWEGEVVEFSARTNGKIRGYRCRTWDIYEGGVPGYGADHIGGHFGYADTWDNLKTDFAAYVRSVAHDLGYENKVQRREVA